MAGPVLVVAADRQATARPKPAVPRNAITAILDAFKTHAVVALGEGPHGNQQGHAFRLALVRDPRFAVTVNDIMVEFGSGKYQPLIDRFMAGESVPRDQLRRVWQDTSVAGPVWERPIYEEFFGAVRALNITLPEARRVRVLLGDAPIEWDQVKRRADLVKWGMAKDRYAANVIKTEVLAKKRRVLIVYGDGHLQGRGFPEGSLTNVLERSPSETRVFTISSAFTDLARMQPDVAAWRAPSIATIRGTVIGAQPYARFYPLPPKKGWSAVRMEDQFDAVLYLGTTQPTNSRFPDALCADAAYMKMRLARMTFDHPQVSKSGIDWLKRHCAALPSK
jgi:hypothetical protein